MHKELGDILEKIANKLGITSKPNISYPESLEFGDFTTNLALVGAKEVSIKAIDLANKIVEEFEKHKPNFIKSINIAGPGFINFFVKEQSIINEIVSNTSPNQFLRGKTILVEHTQPNPFKEFHIGHLMNNAIGESISRILSTVGADVKQVTYHGDVGLHVAKTVWGMQKSKEKDFTVVSMGLAYKEGNDAYENDESAKKEIIIINKAIYDRTDKEINRLYDLGKKLSLDHFEELYAKLDSRFAFHFYESEAGPIGAKIVSKFIERGVFEKSEGAIVFKGEKYGLHTRVFLSSEGLPTYETKELGLVEMKKKQFHFDHSVTVTANEQNDFFKVIEKVVGEIYPELSEKVQHISHGILRFSTGKMSSRKGNIISAESLIEDIKKIVVEKMHNQEISGDDVGQISNDIAIGAIKYSILRQTVGSDVVFDSTKSVSFEGDSGPYLQYSAVRAQSVLLKAENQGMESKSPKILPEQVTALERLLIRYPKIIERAAYEYAPQHIVNYLTNLASVWNSFYASQKIIDDKDTLSTYRLFLAKSFLKIMTGGLFLLGIKTPQKM